MKWIFSHHLVKQQDSTVGLKIFAHHECSIYAQLKEVIIWQQIRPKFVSHISTRLTWINSILSNLIHACSHFNVQNTLQYLFSLTWKHQTYNAILLIIIISLLKMRNYSSVIYSDLLIWFVRNRFGIYLHEWTLIHFSIQFIFLSLIKQFPFKEIFHIEYNEIYYSAWIYHGFLFWTIIHINLLNCQETYG